MNEIAVIVEGQTEQAFVRQLLQPHLAQWNMHIWATLPGRIFKRGGVRPWAAIQGDILRSLRERKDRICSTMFDFYAMPCDWPGRAEAARHPWPERGEIVECAMHGNIVKAIGSDFDPRRFIPYVQIHEFEALFFTDINILAATVCANSPTQAEETKKQLEMVLKKYQNPEAINDGSETAPSKQIIKRVLGYHKTLHGPIIADQIGLVRLRRSCANFSQWVGRLEMVAQQQSWLT